MIRKNAFAGAYNRGDATVITLHYECLDMILDSEKCKSTIGFGVNKNVARKELEIIGKNMHRVDLPSFRAFAIPSYSLEKRNSLSMVNLMLLMRYKKVFRTTKMLPVISITNNKGSFVYIPFPTFLEKFLFVKNPLVEMANIKRRTIPLDKKKKE